MSLAGLSLISCKNEKTVEKTAETISEPAMEFQNKAHELVYQMVEKAGTFQDLLALKDVSYTYFYTTPDNDRDSANEQYIFDGELSYSNYFKHERTLANLEGTFEQGYDGKNFWLKHNGEYISDSNMMKRVVFNRKTNFYWFTMMQKLTDPGLNYEFVGEDTIEGKDYNIVKISFNSDKPTDIYQLYLNKKTSLVDQFLFTVADFNKMDPFLMKVKYEEINGLHLPTTRIYTAGNWEGQNLSENWIKVNWKNIKFNTNIPKTRFEENK